jgi:DNA repair protein RadC
MINHKDVFTFKSLLAESLREKSGSYVIEELFNRFSSVAELLEASEEELSLINGIGKAKAKQIVASLKLAKMLTMPLPDPYIIRSPRDAHQYLVKDFMHLQQEHMVVIGLNTKNHIMFKETVFIGSLNSCIVHPREIFKPLIRKSCASGVIAHPHPSGDPTPSREDIELTKRLAHAGEILGIEILDHLVIAHDRYVSLKELGHL